MMRSAITCFPLLAILVVACGAELGDDGSSTQASQAGEIVRNVAGDPGPAPALDNDPPAISVPQILAAGTVATYKAALPKVAYSRLQKILESPSTLYWDKQIMPPTYQDTVGGTDNQGQPLPIGARRNNAGKNLIVEPGKKLFSADGQAWAFPFGHTGGADESTSLFIVNFMSLPAQGGKILPVAFTTVDRPTSDGLRLTRWDWTYPRGTVVGEILFVRDPAGALVTTEIRVRERYADRWATNAFRPFPTSQSLSVAIKKLRPNWATVPALAAAVTQIENQQSITAKTLSSPAFNNLVTLQGAEDAPLPDLADNTLVKELLTKTTFVSSYGEAWKQSGNLTAFGARGNTAAFGIVADRSNTGPFEVRETTCDKCHNQGGTFIADIVPQAILYGDVWGNDRIFSFHPFEPSLIQGAGDENRQVRAAFTQAGLVERYDATKHPPTLYKAYTPTRSR